MFKKIKVFITDVRNEFKKVTWPTKEQTIRQTGAVMVITGITSVFLGIIDVGLSELVKQIIG
jgi:preprotein translocase subunit SecE